MEEPLDIHDAEAMAALADWEIVCLSHLPWQATLFQRPHHLMRRLSAWLPVTYVAPMSFRRFRPEAMRRDGIVTRGADGGVRYRHLAYTPLSGRSSAALRSTVGRLLRAAKDEREVRAREGGVAIRGQTLLWIEFPPFAAGLGQAGEAIAWKKLVFDVMDPFRQFQQTFAHSHAVTRLWMEKADLILAGGEAMRADLGDLADRALALPSGVDVEHFQASGGETDADKSGRLANIRSRRVAGYAGSLDERIDWRLLEETATALPEWRFEFAGPGNVPEGLSRLSNVAILGPIPYAALPDLYRRWAIGLVPFATTALGRMLSPTKVPEYLAAGLDVLSTELPDVRRFWGDDCWFGGSGADWVRVLRSLPDPQARREATRREADLRSASWDAKARAVLAHLMTLI